MTTQEPFEPLTAPREALGLFSHAYVSDVWTATELLRAYQADLLREPRRSGDECDFLYLLAFMYHTGHIEGIREERAKRKKSR